MKLLTLATMPAFCARAIKLACLASLLTGVPVSADNLFTVRQTFEVSEIPDGTKNVRGWFWMPEDRPEQRVLDFKIVEAPENVRITRDPRYGRSWIYAEARASKDKPLRVVTEFKAHRKTVNGLADVQKAASAPAVSKQAFAYELRADEKHMEVTPKIRRLADELAGKETNPVLQARKFFEHVIDASEHYSKLGAMPKGLCLGSAEECMAGTGDCCTDQHALFIALCRARNIPCRLMFGSRLKPENEGKDHDPGYRCWPNFFVSGLGWIPMDISSADTVLKGRIGEWFGGLDDNRMEWAEGRDFDLEPRSAVRPDLVIRGWVEIEGKPTTKFTRTVNFTKQVIPATPAVSTSARAALP